jgi:hypothetical protein
MDTTAESTRSVAACSAATTNLGGGGTMGRTTGRTRTATLDVGQSEGECQHARKGTGVCDYQHPSPYVIAWRFVLLLTTAGTLAFSAMLDRRLARVDDAAVRSIPSPGCDCWRHTPAGGTRGDGSADRSVEWQK